MYEILIIYISYYGKKQSCCNEKQGGIHVRALAFTSYYTADIHSMSKSNRSTWISKHQSTYHLSPLSCSLSFQPPPLSSRDCS